MNEFTYNPRSEVLTTLFGTNEAQYVYDGIGNHSLYPANSLNQYATSSIAYDADGNMTRHGDMDFTWDAENRLTVVDNGVTNIVNTYDYKHRRVHKTVNGSAHSFIYDGWNLIGETINDMDTCHYFWGLDLSDSLQGAGGVGGLLAVSQNGSMYYPVCDNNGNITAYLDDFGNTVAAYEYNAFGETLSQSGSKGNDFAFRFSTKYHDNETGLYYYGYRFYNPALRTWLNRDPIEEEGGRNLYGFCENNGGINKVDGFGLVTGSFRGVEKIGMPVANTYGAVFPSFFLSCECKCKRLKCDMQLYYTLYVADEENNIWGVVPPAYPGEPVPSAWSRWSYKDKYSFTKKHEEKHVYWYRVFYEGSRQTLSHHEDMLFRSTQECEEDARVLEKIIYKSYNELRKKQRAHELWERML